MRQQYVTFCDSQKAPGYSGAEISFEALAQELIQTRLSKETRSWQGGLLLVQI